MALRRRYFERGASRSSQVLAALLSRSQPPLQREAETPVSDQQLQRDPISVLPVRGVDEDQQ